jgi:hypothetical protein
MGMAYNICVEISRYDIGKIEAIKIAANREWEFNGWNEHDGELTASADGSLGFLESEEQFAKRFSVAVWRANGKFCEVVIHAGCLEEIPYGTHSLDANDFERIKAEIEDSTCASVA